MYHLSSSCSKDDRGNLLVTLFSITDHSGSMIFKLGKCASREDVEVHLHAPQTKNEHLWLWAW